MPRQKKYRPPVAEIGRKGAMERFRKLAGLLEKNPGGKLNVDELLSYVQQSGDGGDPADMITIQLDKTVEVK